MTLDESVSQAHHLRKINKFISLDSIRNKIRYCYCPARLAPAGL